MSIENAVPDPARAPALRAPSLDDTQARHRLVDLLDDLDAVIWERTLPSGRLTFVSRRVEDLLGHPVRQWLKEPGFWEEVLDPADKARVVAERRSHMEAGRDHALEYRARSKGGRAIWLRDVVRIFRGDRGEALLARGVLSDISERKAAEQELARRNEGLEMLRVVAAATTRAASLDEALAEAIGRICAFTGWPVGHAYVWDAEARVLVPTDAWHVADTETFESFRRVTMLTRLAPGAGLPGRVYECGEPAWIADLARDPNFPRRKLCADIGVVAGFALPVSAGNDVVAVLEFFSAEATPPDDLVLQFAGHVGALLGRVADRLRAQERERTAEMWTRGILESTHEAFVSMDPDGRIRDWNRESERLFGWKREEVLGRFVRDVVVPARLHEAHDSGLRRLHATGEAPFLGKRLEVTGLHRDGSEIPVEMTVAPMRWKGSTVYNALLHDIRDRRRTEEDLRRQATHVEELERRLRLLLDSVEEGIYGLDLDGRAMFVNRAAARMLGVAPADLLGHDPHELIHHLRADGSHLPASECVIRRALAEGVVRRHEDVVFWRPDGTPVPVSVAITPIREDDCLVGAVVTFLDLRPRRTAEEQARRAAGALAVEQAARQDAEDQRGEMAALMENLERVNRELDQFAYVTSHDLKAPLRAIANLAAWLEEDLRDRLTPETREYTRLLRERADRMQQLIDALLEYSRAGRPRLPAEPVDVGAVARDVVRLLGTPAHVVVDIASDLPTLRTHELTLQQVLQNLLSNAFKYARSRVAVTGRDAGEAWEISVADDGPGIAPEFHEKVWGIFQRLHAPDEGEGTGVGLAIVKKVVEAQGGHAWIESTPGGGATFRFTWRNAADEEADA